MRNAFFILLFANLAFLAWSRWIDVPQPAPPNEAIERLPRLKLVGEQPQTPRARQMPTKARKSTSLDEPVAAAQCMSVGPFADLVNTSRATSLLREKGFDPQQRASEAETAEGFWVYVGGLKSESETNRVLHSLERNGIKDARAMAETEEGRRVSAGVFSEFDRAARHAAAIRKIGLNAEVAERKVPGTVYWVDLSVRPGAAVPTQDLLAQVSSSQFGVQPCPAASAAAGAQTEGAGAPGETVAAEQGSAASRPAATTVAGTPKLP